MIKQQGSAHVIIIVVLVVALVGALGYIFWQSLAASDKDTATDTSKEAKKEDANTDGEDDATVAVPEGYMLYEDDAAGFSLAYPQEWGTLVAANTRPNASRLGANGENTKALADSAGVTRVAVYTKNSFVAKMASGYTVKYDGTKVLGGDTGTDATDVQDPISSSDAYAFNYGDAGFIAYDLFFAAGDSVVYVTIGNSEVIQTQIAKSITVK